MSDFVLDDEATAADSAPSFAVGGGGAASAAGGELQGSNVIMRDGELFMNHPTPKPLSFKAATSKQTGEKVHLHQLSRELDTPLPDFLAPLVELARKLEFNVTFL